MPKRKYEAYIPTEGPRRLLRGIRLHRSNGWFRAGALLIKGDRVERTYLDGDTLPAASEIDEVLDGFGLMACPGLVDIHTHGRSGFDFVDATEEQVAVMSRDYAAHGITTVLPTLASATVEDWYAAARRISAAAGTPGGTRLAGIHLEGRYLSPAKRGAHALELLAPPDIGEIDGFDRGEGALPILRVTYAPELDSKDWRFTDALEDRGIKISIGHTEADYKTALASFAHGADCVTHIYNAMPPFHHRAGGPVALAMNLNRVYAELICDGLHVTPEVIYPTQRLMQERLLLVSDSMAGTGCPDGEYRIAGQTARVVGGVARTADGALAGSTLDLLDGVQRLAEVAGISFGHAILSASLYPARYLGMRDRGLLEPGNLADLFLLPAPKAKSPVRVMIGGRFLDE